MYIAALWLASDAASDVFIPLEDRADALKKLITYPELDFLERARAIAEGLQSEEGEFPV